MVKLHLGACYRSQASSHACMPPCRGAANQFCCAACLPRTWHGQEGKEAKAIRVLLDDASCVLVELQVAADA